MARIIEEPTVTEGAGTLKDGLEYKHPAYAKIGASRISGGDMRLFGSDFIHGGCVRIRITEAKLTRSLSSDFIHGSITPYIEVDLSEAQWATFVSSLNVGDGVPATLRYRNGEMIPDLPVPQSRVDQFGGEHHKRLNEARKGLDELKEILAAKLSKKQADELSKKIDSISWNIGSNLDFVAKSFGKHMEKVVEGAKVEVNAYATRELTKAGLAALGIETSPDHILTYDNSDPKES